MQAEEARALAALGCVLAADCRSLGGHFTPIRMGSYDTQQVCLNGHQITASYNRFPQHRRKRCSECGAETIHQCQSCSADIRGYYEVPGVISVRETEVPRFCEECGASYPWAKAPEVEFDPSAAWYLVHPRILAEAKDRFLAKQYADAAEAAMKAVNVRVKKLWLATGQPEKDGKPLMLSAFSVNNPPVRLGDLSSESGRNIQEGYMHLFAGAMQGIRNPKAHDNITIGPERAMHFLILASLLMSKLDECVAA